MSERAPYSRLYWSLIDDKKFEKVYDDDRLFSWWVRLLMIADQAHPASAHIPGAVSRRCLDALVEAGLVDVQAGGRYRIHGLDAERDRRRMAATRDPDGTQAGTKRDPDGLRTTGLRRDETSKDETRRADVRSDDAVETYMVLAGKYPSSKVRDWLDRLSAQFGASKVATYLREEWTEQPSGAIGRVQERLKEAKKPKPVYGLRPGSPEYELARLMADQERTA